MNKRPYFRARFDEIVVIDGDEIADAEVGLREPAEHRLAGPEGLRHAAGQMRDVPLGLETGLRDGPLVGQEGAAEAGMRPVRLEPHFGGFARGGEIEAPGTGKRQLDLEAETRAPQTVSRFAAERFGVNSVVCGEIRQASAWQPDARFERDPRAAVDLQVHVILQ